MWFKSIIINYSQILDGNIIKSFRLQNQIITSSGQYLINIFGYEQFNSPLFLTEIQIYPCQLNFQNKTGLLNLKPPQNFTYNEIQMIITCLSKVISRKVTNHPKSKKLFEEFRFKTMNPY